MVWRIYFNDGTTPGGRKGWRDFGKDYPTLAAAKVARDQFRAYWGDRYQIRKVHAS